MFLQTTGTNCGYEPTISVSSSRGEIFARAHHRKGSLHRSAEKGFCCVSSRTCGYRIWSTSNTNSHRKWLHTLKPRFPVAHTTRTHHSHTSLQFWTRTVIETLTTPVHMRYQTQVQCITHGIHMKWSYEFTCVPYHIQIKGMRGEVIIEGWGSHGRIKNIEITVSGMEWWWGSREVWKRWKMGCSAVSVMAQECTYDEQ